jgi:ribosomal protein RSM22 (predicted rRNA methylase)
MQIPESYQLAVERELSSCPHDALQIAADRIIQHYRREKKSQPLFQNEASRLAYLAVRMPATYAAIAAVLQEGLQRQSFIPRTMVDIGAGPGTGGFAAAECFDVQSICFVEPSHPMSAIGKRLCSASPSKAVREARWIQELKDEPADVALLSYLIGEMAPAEIEPLLERLWANDTKMVIVIEPGTPAGYRRILAVRAWALKKGAHLIAPCPHSLACPLTGSDWCHFPARVERTRLHKLLKSGSLGYEDEKFSYLSFGKNPSQVPTARIVKAPCKASGWVRLHLCTDGKLKEIVVSRKESDYRLARNAKWGDGWMM